MALSTIVAIIFVAGLSGGLVNWAMARSDGADSRPLWCDMVTGVAAAFLVPLLLHFVSSDLLDKALDTGGKTWGRYSLIFGGFCLVAAISSKAFIQSVSRRVLQMAEDAKKAAIEAKDQSEKAAEKADSASLLSQAAHDQAEYLAPTAALAPPAVGKGTAPDDPWAGQFGGSPTSNGRVLEAEFHALPDIPGGWVAVRLRVRSTDAANPLRDPVQFYLHDTFPNPTPTVPPGPDESVTLTITSWGAFTVGVLADGGKTRLELDLATHPDAPEPFRSR